MLEPALSIRSIRTLWNEEDCSLRAVDSGIHKKLNWCQPLRTLKKLYGRHYDLVNPYDVAVFSLISDGFATTKPQTGFLKKVREKSRECHNHKPQPFPDRKRKPTNPNKHKSNKRTKSTKISSLFPKRDNRNTKRTENTRTK